MKEIIDSFFASFFNYSDFRDVYDKNSTPENMINIPAGEDGWFSWKPIEGTLIDADYHKVERDFNVVFPASFIEWHKRYFFLSGACRIIKLPSSSPKKPLYDIIEYLDYDVSRDLAKEGFVVFADDNDAIGPYVFDARESKEDNEFPIRIYDFQYGGDLDGLSEIIFSSFSKLLECITYLLENIRTMPLSEIYPEFLRIDPLGAGKSGVDFWLERIAIEKMEEGYDYD